MPRIVLIAEDDPISQRMAAAVVESCGYRAQIVQAGSPVPGSSSESDFIPIFFCSTLEMPVMDGIQVLKAMKQSGGVEICPIVVFTSHHQQETVRGGDQAGR